MKDANPRERLVLAALVLTGAVVFTRGIGWGLPSRDIDTYLFGDREVWTGEKILALTGGRAANSNRGADVDINPLAKTNAPVLLNATDKQRAEILTRYRLYTYQPDEMITMMALANMNPGKLQLDPKLYQYGGLWIYPVGFLLKCASMAGYVTLRADQAYYLDHPEAFARFYVIARMYTAAWGVIGVLVVHWLARRLTGDGMLIAAAAALVYILMPIIIDMTHEAKPHLPAAILMLLAITAAIRYVDTGEKAWWITTGVLCGAAFGMVLSALPIFVILPIMTMLRPQSSRERMRITLMAGALGAGVYLLTNPYLLINAVSHRDILRSNFGNSLAMYEIGRWQEGFANAIRLAGQGASPLLAVVGAIGLLVLTMRSANLQSRPHVLAPASNTTNRRVSAPDLQPDLSIRPVVLLMLAPIALIMLQFIALAAGKPAEYGRFAVLPDVLLGLFAISLIASMYQARGLRIVLFLLVISATAHKGRLSLNAFERDEGGGNSRIQAARELRTLANRGMKRLAVAAEPAPYNMPPFDLFGSELWLCPKNWNVNDSPRPDVAIWPDQSPHPPLAGITFARPLGNDKISWAGKPILIWMRESSEPPATNEAAEMRSAPP